MSNVALLVLMVFLGPGHMALAFQRALQEDPIPQIPANITASTYEAYLSEVARCVLAPATEYTNTAPAHGITGGLAMASDSFPGLKKQIEDVVDNNISGDFYETGTWRGGTSIYMLAVLHAYENLTGNKQNRMYYGFDSFEGFKPQGQNEALDAYLSKQVYTAPLEIVKTSFAKCGVLDDRVHFVKGYFEETMPNWTIPNRIAVLRLDGDLYSSTKVVLDKLYPYVQKRGWVLIDDYTWHPKEAGATKLCKDAVDEYREAHNIQDNLTNSYMRPSWQKTQDGNVSVTADGVTKRFSVSVAANDVMKSSGNEVAVSIIGIVAVVLLPVSICSYACRNKASSSGSDTYAKVSVNKPVG